jgi:hypothetical protein
MRRSPAPSHAARGRELRGTNAGALPRAPPIPPSGLVQCPRGFRLGFANAPPRLSTPRRRSASPPEGAAPGGFPLETPPCRGRREKRAWLLPTLTFCAPAFSRPLTRSASLAAYVARPPVAQRPRTPRAFLRRFRPTAQSRSHAGCALGGDRLATSVCGQTPLVVVTDRSANWRPQNPISFS